MNLLALRLDLSLNIKHGSAKTQNFLQGGFWGGVRGEKNSRYSPKHYGVLMWEKVESDWCLFYFPNACNNDEVGEKRGERSP